MPFKTNLNVTPYYDDFSAANNFQQILARPGFAVQAREVTQMQSILKNQIEQIGNFLLKEGAMVVPGSARITGLQFIKLENKDVNLDSNIKEYERLLKLNKHMNELFKKKLRDLSKRKKKIR